MDFEENKEEFVQPDEQERKIENDKSVDEFSDKLKKAKGKTVVAVAVSVILTLVLSVTGTVFVLTQTGYNSLGLSHENWERIKWGFSAVDSFYYEDIDEDTLVDGALMGLSIALDEYSSYIPAGSAESFVESVNAEEYSGVGIRIYEDEEEKCVRVLEVIEASPAQKAGIEETDIIKAVNGEMVGADIDKTAKLLTGKKDTAAVVTVIHSKDGREEEVSVTREEIKQDVIGSKILKDNIGYIKISRFGINTYKSFVDEYNRLADDGMEKLILDLRDNPGGYFESAASIAEIFLDKGDVIVSTKDGNGHTKEYRAAGGGTDMEIVILCNENTASASEVVIAALHDNQKAKTVGEKTYGKGVTQAVLSYGDGSIFKITDSRYYTPKNVCIHKMGIEPDTVIKNSGEGDAQLEEAIRIISEK